MNVRSLLLVAGIFFGLTAPTFAQANFDTGSTPVTAVVKSGHTEQTGDITWTQTSGTSVSGTLFISYGVPITIPFTSVTVTGTLGYAGSVAVNLAASSNSAGYLVINVPAGVLAPGTIRVSGVRVGLSGSGLSVLDASLSSTGNTITTGQLNPRVISSIAAGISALTVVQSTPTIRVTEGFLNAFSVTNVTDPVQTISTMVRLTLLESPSPGVSMSFEGVSDSENANTGALSVPNAFSTANCTTGAILGVPVVITSASTSLNVCYRVTADTNISLLERLAVDVTIDPLTGAQPLASDPTGVTATFAPIGTAFAANGTVITTPIPRYAADEVGPATLVPALLTITMSKSVYVDGEAVTATGFLLKNQDLGPETIVELAVWLEFPGTEPISVLNLGADSSFILPPNLSLELGPLTFFTVTASFPRGSYAVNSRMIDPVTKEFWTEDINPFQIQ